MNNNLKFIVILICVFVFTFVAFWCGLTNFGEKTGVWFGQKARIESRIDNTYTLYTDIWISDFLGTDNTIEYQSSCLVNYCQLDSAKKAEKQKAWPIYLKIKAIYNDNKHHKIICP
jgi:hypothetical protein